MKNSARNLSWKQIVRAHSKAFIKWIETSGVRYRFFDKLASDLERYLLYVLADDYYEQYSTRERCEAFASNIPKVLSRCDEDIYDKPLVADAYAYVHLLDRYRRFWDVLIELTRGNLLPMRDSGIEVLDVGTGPAPALFAVEDFYRALQEYATLTENLILNTPLPKLQSVEASRGMVHLAHNLAEYTGQNGPFQAAFETFDGLDLEGAREMVRQQLLRETADWLGSDELAPRWVQNWQPGWQDTFRYNLIIFSNFLTKPDRVAQLQTELNVVFKGLRAGGIVVIVGGTDKRYQDIYSMVEKVAFASNVQRMTQMPESILCDYSNERAFRIKESYTKIWGYLENYSANLEDIKVKIPDANDLWNPNVSLKGPKRFGLRVFRKIWPYSRNRVKKNSTKAEDIKTMQPLERS